MKITNNTSIWITGASSGIGEHLAYQLAQYKPTLILSARSREKLEQVAAKCNSLGAKTFVQTLDLSDSNSIQQAYDTVSKHFDRIDILINNAGVSQRSLAYETGLDVDRKIMQINYFGTIQLTKLVLPQMMSRKSGHIVAVSSLAGKLGFPLRSAYSASKHALHGFFETLAMELDGFNIKITIAIPSHIKTDIDARALTGDGTPSGQRDKAIQKGIPPEKCARKIIRAIEKNKLQVFIAGKDIIAYYIYKISPALFLRFVKLLNLK